MITDNSLAAGQSAEYENAVLSVGGTSKKRRVWLISNYDDVNKEDVVENTPKLFTSSEAVGDEQGWGYGTHYLARATEKGSRGSVEFWVTAQPTPVDAVAATATITIGVTTAEAGFVYLWIDDEPYYTTVAAGATDAQIATDIAAKINSVQGAPFTAVAAAAVVTITAKPKGAIGNLFQIHFNLGTNQKTATGVTAAVVDFSGGDDGTLDLASAFDGSGTGDSQNSNDFTAFTDSYGVTAEYLNEVSAWNGATGDNSGNWAGLVRKPVRSVKVSHDTLNNMKTITDAQTTNRTVAYLAIPRAVRSEVWHAAEAVGACELVNARSPHATYVDVPLSGHINKSATDWTADYDERDTAAGYGIATTRELNGQIVLSTMVTMSRPASTPVTNNAYRSYRNISVAQNMLKIWSDFWASRPSFTGVEDIAEVDPGELPYVLDLDSAADLSAEVIDQWGDKALIWDKVFPTENQTVTIREQNNGFDFLIPFYFSLEGTINATKLRGDINVSALAG